MRRVLLVSFFFPPSNVVGAVRAAKLARYLPAQGWEPTVLTVDRFGSRPATLALESPVPRIVRAPFVDPVGAVLSRRCSAPGVTATAAAPGEATTAAAPPASPLRGRLMELARSLPGVTTMHVPDRAFPWYGPAVGMGLRTLEAQPYDAILSTAPPPTAHLVASTLAGLTAVPWIADYRDLWSGNHATALSGPRRRMERRIERWVLSRAAALVSVSGPFAEAIGRLHGRRVEVVTNGFDPAEAEEAAHFAETGAGKDGPLTLTYTGAVYDGFQDPGPLLEGIALLRDRQGLAPGELAVRFYGSDQERLPAAIAHHGVGDFVRCHGFVPRAEAVASQHAAHALVVLDWNAPEERGVLPLKALEYLQARKPILITGARPDSLLVRLLREAGVGSHCATAADVATTLTAWLLQHRTRGRLDYVGDPEVIERYSWSRLAGDYAGLLAAVSEA